MKKITVLLASLILMCSSSLFAEKFNWSQCWCNYGGGIQKGDILISADLGLVADEFVNSLQINGGWHVPAGIVEFHIAQPIWKLPFTFGGCVGWNIQGHNRINYVVNNIYLGGSLAYHFMLPPKKLDLYASAKLGVLLRIKSANTPTWYLPVQPDFNTSIGASWYFTDNFGVNAEIGYPVEKIGVIFKF